MIRALLLVHALLLPVSGRPSPAPPRVLVLYSMNRLVPAYAQFDNRFRIDLGARVADADFFTEFLDLSRVSGEVQEERLAQSLHAKYADRQPSVIVTGGIAASLFADRHRAELFPGIPIVYGGVPSMARASLRLDSLTTFVPFDYPVRQTAEVAARLVPNVRQILMVSGNGALDQRFVADARDQMMGWTGPPLSFVSDRTFADLAKDVAKLDANTALVLLSFEHDPGGQPWEPSASVADRLAHSASVPSFGPSETYIGRGIVGGVMASLNDLSPSIAGVVIQILDGVPANAVRVRAMPVHSVFDARELRRWQIASRTLPPGADVRFVPVSMLVRDHALIASLTMLVAIAILVALVGVERRRRRRAETEQSTMNVMAGALAHELSQPLTAQQLNVATALKLLDRGRLDPHDAHDILTDIASAAGRASDIAQAIGQFLHRKEMRRERLALDGIIARALPRVFEATTFETMRVEVEMGQEMVIGDDVLLGQVIFNLLVNAREAVQRIAPTHGVITVRAGRDDDAFVRLEVTDNGPGIPADLADRAFDLFFTTKDRGLGLGLALCRSIVEAHGGTIAIDPAATPGARIVARLPRATPRPPDAAVVGSSLAGSEVVMIDAPSPPA